MTHWRLTRRIRDSSFFLLRRKVGFSREGRRCRSQTKWVSRGKKKRWRQDCGREKVSRDKSRRGRRASIARAASVKAWKVEECVTWASRLFVIPFFFAQRLRRGTIVGGPIEGIKQGRLNVVVEGQVEPGSHKARQKKSEGAREWASDSKKKKKKEARGSRKGYFRLVTVTRGRSDKTQEKKWNLGKRKIRNSFRLRGGWEGGGGGRKTVSNQKKRDYCRIGSGCEKGKERKSGWARNEGKKRRLPFLWRLAAAAEAAAAVEQSAWSKWRHATCNLALGRHW